ncbi:MAG: HAMP domain-containing sensor histidine kinase [Anaerolineae bacterium]
MMFRSIRWHLPFTYALIAFFSVALLGVLMLTHLRGYYATQELEYLHDNSLAISNAMGQILTQPYTAAELQDRVNTFNFFARAHVRVLSADHQQILAESDMMNAVDVTTVRWSRAVGAETMPAGLFSIVIASAQEIPPCESDASCDIVISQGAIAETQNAMVTGPMLTTENGASSGGLFFSARPSPYGFDLGRRHDEPLARSDQVIEQAIYNPSTYELLGYVVLSDGPAYGTEVVNGVTASFLVAGVAAISLAALAGWGISRNMSTPLTALAYTTERMASGDLSVRVNIKRKDEIGTLASGFNSMAVRVEEMVTALRRFIGDAAHELNTPLTALHTNLELVAAEDISPRALELVTRAQNQLKRLEALTKSLLHLSRLESGSLRENLRPVNLTEFTHETAASFASQAEQAGVALNLELPGTPITLEADESQLQSALGNLLDNAIKFTPEGGTVSVRLARAEQWAEIRVRDTGIGITNEDIPLLFERFYRGHNVSEYPGSGLGLSIVHAVAEHYGGRVKVQRLSPGTEFTLSLPV